ncbi:MAG: 50S ribosomal protein L24 [bacterium]
MKIKSGDNVKVLAGKDHGKTGKVIQVFSANNRLVVEGVNKLKKHLKKRGTNAGQKMEFFAPLNASNVELICPKCNRPTRVGKKTLENGSRIRVCKKCKETIE